MGNEKEVWKPVRGYEGLYEVSNEGRVRSINRNVKRKDGRSIFYKGVILKSQETNRGYLSVGLSKKGKSKHKTVHRIVTDTFYGPCPDGLEVCHIDGDKKNNKLSNLKYDTPEQNRTEIYSIKPDEPGYSKLSYNDVICIHKKLLNGELCSKIAKDYGLSYGFVYAIREGKTWSRVTKRKYREKDRSKFKSYVFDNKTVLEIYKCLQKGERVCDLAEKYGVHRTTISRIKKKGLQGKLKYEGEI